MTVDWQSRCLAAEDVIENVRAECQRWRPFTSRGAPVDAAEAILALLPPAPKYESPYRILEAGEVIQDGDEVDGSADGWRDDARWRPAIAIGKAAPDPSVPSHRIYRRKITRT